MHYLSEFLCRLCGADIDPGAHRRIGICTKCVMEEPLRARSFSAPAYRQYLEQEVDDG